MNFFFYQEIRPHGSLGYKTPNEYDEYSRGIGCEKGAIDRVVVVKNETLLIILQNQGV